MNEDRDWYGALGTALLEEAEATPPIDLDAFDVDEFVADVMAGRFDVPAGALVRRRRRWKRYGAIGVVIAVTAGGAVAATQLGNDKRPAARAYEGVACVVEDRWSAPMMARELTDDPIEDCRQQWLSGAMSDGGNGPPLDVAPDLFACVSPTEIIAVFPRPIRSDLSCADLGLDEADLTNLTDNPYLKLKNGLYEQSKLCLPHDEAIRAIEDLLADLGFDDWTLAPADPTAVPTAEDVCTFGYMDAEQHVINLRMRPPRRT